LLLLLILCFKGVVAQSSVCSIGGDISGADGSVAYSIGQTFFQTYNSSDHSIYQGVQQPYEISVITGVEVMNGTDSYVNIYPNPVTDCLSIMFSDDNKQDLHFVLYNMQGQELFASGLYNTHIRVEMDSYAPGLYFIKVMSEGKTIKTFKVVKQ